MSRSPVRIFRPWLGAFALALLPLAGNQAGAAPRAVYAGTLQGAGEVVMELEAAQDGTLTGRYFYPKQGVDIPLKGTPAALYEPKPYYERKEAGLDPDEDAPAGRAAAWQGARDADGYRGQWVDARTGKRRSFQLRRVAEYDPDALAPDSVRAVTDAISGGMGSGIAFDVSIDAERAPYETRKLAGYAVPAGPDIGTPTLAYRMWRDPRTKFSYPRLSRHPDAKVLERVNGLLEQRHWQMSLAALACKASAYTDDNPAAGTLGSYDEEEIKVDWLSSALMTVSESGSLYCGGAHPNNHFEPYTFDLLRGEYLDWNHVFDAYESDGNGFRTESATLLEVVNAARNALASTDATGAADGESLEGCVDLWPSFLALGAEAPGMLSLSVSGVGHAMGVCLGTHAVVPFKDLAPYLKPGGEAYLVVD
ncbi:hypothetical protein D9M68_439990 [compost metagenome]